MLNQRRRIDLTECSISLLDLTTTKRLISNNKRNLMEIRRAVVLPVSLATARQHLAVALASPLVVQQGNLILAKIVCYGLIKENKLWVRYIEFGRSPVYIDLMAHLEETPGGVRLHMTIAAEETPGFLIYLPLLAVYLFFVSSSLNSGLKAELLGNYFLLLAFSATITFLWRSLNTSFSQMRITKLKGVLEQMITG
ncbi:hypothetical protein [Spirosoma flavum]|uniref:Uncharacterized protein n=1 Tax=Spirosoma flavum TaxID=2048557 RepID=A0ABW6AHF6_9BACT